MFHLEQVFEMARRDAGIAGFFSATQCKLRRKLHFLLACAQDKLQQRLIRVIPVGPAGAKSPRWNYEL